MSLLFTCQEELQCVSDMNWGKSDFIFKLVIRDVCEYLNPKADIIMS